MRSHNVSLDVLPQPNLPPVSAQANQLVQVFVNLLLNAEQAIREVRDRGTVRVRLGQANGQVWVSFQDDGPGIQPNILSKIFDPFFTTKPPGKGTGLGLSICMALVKQYGGNIEAQNAPGGGSVFTVLLPAGKQLPASAPTGAAAPAQRASMEGKKILVVEDEQGIRELVAAGLATRGVTVEGVSTGEEALTRLNAGNRYDAILCDMKMPGISGTEVLEKLCHNTGGLKQPFIIMTGDLVSPATIESLRHVGATVIQKPFRVADLTAILSDELSKASPAE